MKHKFLLDENILHFAIKGTNERDEPDETSSELVKRIGANCHTIILNEFLRDRYWQQLNKILKSGLRAYALEPVAFMKQIFQNSEKQRWSENDPPQLPTGVRIPRKDVEIVRLAHVAGVRIITSDRPLLEAIRAASGQLHLEALRPTEALPLAADS